MKLVTYLAEGKERVGVLTADGAGVCALPYEDMNEAVAAGLEAVEAAAAKAEAPVPLGSVKLLAPIPRPRQDVICLGINYMDHAKEAEQYDKEAFGKEKPIPIYFSKRVTRAVDPEGDIDSHPGLVQRLDYESELAVILGKTAKNVPADKAGEYIFGYTVLNDVTARELQTAHKQWYFGKGLDGFTPMGPCILTADETAFPPALDISCRVNGEQRQSSNTRLLMTTIPEMIRELSSGMTLLAGTIVATGTPSGVCMGMEDPVFLKSGDVVECEIEGIGVLRNTVK